MAYNKDYYTKNKDKVKVDRIKYYYSPKGKYSEYKKGARIRGHEFNLSFNEFKDFWQNDCTYCGSAIATIGLDRINPLAGYFIDNVVSCCSSCNTMKMCLQEEEWLNRMLTILKHKGII